LSGRWARHPIIPHPWFREFSAKESHLYQQSAPLQLTGAFYAGLLDGLLGVAGMMKLYEIDISPVDHSRKFPA